MEELLFNIVDKNYIKYLSEFENHVSYNKDEIWLIWYLQYAKILYEHLVHFVEERHLMNYFPLLAINNLYTNIESLYNNEIDWVYGYLKQAIDLNFLVNLFIMLKICKFCHKTFLPKNSKIE